MLKQAEVFLTRAKIYRASRTVVTPFSPFILADYYLSSEIDQLGLQWLNRRAKSFRDTRTRDLKCRFAYCQVDQLGEFAETYLPRIKSRFVLLTGKWGLPGLEMSEVAFEISRHPQLNYWFSQNQVFPDISISPFPYGVDFRTAPAVVRESRRMRKKNWRSRHQSLFIPYARVHDHLKGNSRDFREKVATEMAQPMTHEKYLSEIGKHALVLSPAGDRPDTYRHWECLAMGAFPVSNAEQELKRLFGENMLFVQTVEEAKNLSPPHRGVSSSIWRLRHWKKRVKRAYKKKERELPMLLSSQVTRD